MSQPEELLNLARSLEPLLAPWRIDDADTWCNQVVFSAGDWSSLMEGPRPLGDPLRFSLSYDSRKKRVTASPWGWPKHQEWGDRSVRTCTVVPRNLRPAKEAPQISVALTRGPEVVLRELLRRFIPQYCALYYECAKEADRLQELFDRTSAQWDSVCAAAGRPGERTQFYCGPFSVSRQYSGFKVDSSSLTADQFRRILEVLG